MTMQKPEAEAFNAETLLSLGFVDVASWVSSPGVLSYQLDGPHAEANAVRLEDNHTLYAFVQDEDVLYIGKTARSIRKRFLGYCRPARSQSTNWRCNGKIREVIERGGEVRIFVFTPISHLHYGPFSISLAAGLEDALIARFNPPWNGREAGKPISEEAEREKTEIDTLQTSPATDVAAEAPNDGSVLAKFEIKLGEAYYEQGIINPGVEASQHLGNHGEPVQIVFSDGAEPIVSSINRTANRNGSVRIVGRNGDISAWFGRHYLKGDIVQASVVDAHRIILHAPEASREHSEPEDRNRLSTEFFYLDENGRPSDALLHEELLGEVENDPDSLRALRERLIAAGQDRGMVNRLYGGEDDSSERGTSGKFGDD